MESRPSAACLESLGQKKELHDRLPVFLNKAYNIKRAEDEERGRIAHERGQSALTALRELQLNVNETRTRHITFRKQVLQVERQRAKFMASLQPPPTELLQNQQRDKVVDVYDTKFIGTSRIPIRKDVVQKVPLLAAAQMDARMAAVEHENEAVVDKTKEYDRKANSRFQKAIIKEKTEQQYNCLMKQLERHVHKTRRSCLLEKNKSVKRLTGIPVPVRPSVFKFDENAAEIAVESILQRRKAKQVNISLMKKKTKKAARLSVGKALTSRTSKETSKQTAPSNLQQSREQAQTSMSRSGPYQSQQSTRSPLTLTESVSLKSAALPNTSSFPSPASSSDSRDMGLEKQTVTESRLPKVKVAVETRDCSSQTVLRSQDFDTALNICSSSSGTSYLSLPSGFGISVSTQTPEDTVSMYQKYLYNRAQRVSSEVFTNTCDKPALFTTRGKFETNTILSVYVKELAAKYFPKETDVTEGTTDSNFPAGTGTCLFLQPNDRHIESKINVEGVRADHNKSKQRSPTAQPDSRPISTVTTHSKVRDGSKTQKALNRDIALRRTPPKAKTRTKNNSAEIAAQKVNTPNPVLVEKVAEVPTDTLVKLSPPITLTVESPESRLVVHLSGSDGKSSGLNSSVKKSNISPYSMARRENCGYRFLSEESSELLNLEEQAGLGWNPTSVLRERCRLDREYFRLPPPASLPLGWRQMQSPHELSTIREMDTPQTSFFDGSQSYTNPSGVNTQAVCTVPNHP